MKSCLRTLISVVYFLTNVALAHAVETHFWAERKAAAARRKSTDRAAGLTLPSDNAAPAGLTQEQYELLAQIPAALQLDKGFLENISVSGVAAPPPLRSGIHPQSLPSASREGGDTPAWLSSLLLPYGAIREIHVSPHPDAPWVLHIQDVHGVLEAQRNMASLIQRLRETTGLGIVGVEGASGPFSFAPYEAYGDPDATAAVADYLMEKGYIGGPEYAALTSPRPPLLWGVEDSALYGNNLSVLKESLRVSPDARKWLGRLTAAADRLKERHYSPALREFDERYSAFEARRESLGDYVRYLLEGAGRNGYSNLRNFLEAWERERTLDFRAVEAERLQLVETLAKELPEPRLAALVQKSLLYRLGRLTYGDYHRFLRNLCEGNGISLRRFTRLNAYIDYVFLAERINRNELLDELAAAEKRTQDRLAIRPEQKRLVAAGRHLALLGKLLGNAMTPADWAYYKTVRPDVLAVAESLASLLDPGEDAIEPVSAEALAPYERFCEYATRRNESLVDNLLVVKEYWPFCCMKKKVATLSQVDG